MRRGSAIMQWDDCVKRDMERVISEWRKTTYYTMLTLPTSPLTSWMPRRKQMNPNNVILIICRSFDSAAHISNCGPLKRESEALTTAPPRMVI